MNETKTNWRYEFKPYIIFAIGLVGIVSAISLAYSKNWLAVTALVSSAVLFFSSFKILKWRKEYRRFYK